MIDFPFLTVTINLYNYERFVSDCIQSILNQTYSNFELIVVDDCSTDDSYKIAKKFEEKDERVKVIKLNKNGGIGKAKNEGIIRSKGEYIVTLDADDMMTKNSLEIRLKAAIDHNVSFVYANAIFFKGASLKDVYKYDLNKISSKDKQWPRRLYCHTVYNIHAATVLMKRDVYKKYGLYDEDLGMKVDREMWLRLFGEKDSNENKISSYFVNEFVAYYRYHSKQVTKKRQKDVYFYRKNEKLCKDKFFMRKKNINKNNTRFLES